MGSLGYFTLKNVKSGQVLDVVGASKTAGALIDQWPSNGGANQKWRSDEVRSRLRQTDESRFRPLPGGVGSAAAARGTTFAQTQATG